MKKIIMMVMVLTLSLGVLAGCSSNKELPETPVAEQPAAEQPSNEAPATDALPLAGKHLKVAMSANYKYFETVTIDASGKEVYEGLDIDILDQMSKDLGFTYEIMNMPFASLIGSLQANQADFVISGMSYTDERAKSVDFSEKYATAKVGVIIPKDSQVKSIEDLKGKKVACSAGTNYENIIKSIEGAELVTFDGQAAVTQELIMGRVDAAITGGTASKKVAEENEGLSFFIMNTDYVGIPLDTYNMAFPKGSELVSLFNTQIAKMNEEGTLNDLIIKWLGADYID